MQSQLSRIQGQNDRRHDLTHQAILETYNGTMAAIENIAELQMATMIGLYELNSKLEKISQQVEYLIENDENDRWLKETAFDIEKEVKVIRGYYKEYPEYAIVQIEGLKEIIEYYELNYKRYSRLSVDEMKWAQNVLSSVDEFYSELLINLGD